MDLNWSLDHSSSFVQVEDDPETDQTADPQDEPESSRQSRRRAPLGIDDSDFEALIEILGTDSDKRNADVGRREMLSENTNNRSDRAVEPVAREIRRSGGAGTRAMGGNVPRSPSRNVPRPMRELPMMETGRAIRYSTPSGSRTASPTLQTPARERSFQIPSPRRTPSPSPARREVHAHPGHGPSSTTIHGFSQSKRELGTSIVGVNDQLEELRKRLRLLKGEVKEFAPHLYRRAFNDADLDVQHATSSEEEQAARRRQHSVAKGKGKAVELPALPSGQLQLSDSEDISSLTEDEAKNALIDICQTLRIDHRRLLSSSTENRFHDLLVPPSSLSDIVRALNLVSYLDGLAWRRHTSQAGPSRTRPAYNIYDEENVTALLDRVRLWERTARSRAGRENG